MRLNSLAREETGLTPVLAVALLIGIFVTFFSAWFGAMAPVWQRDQQRAHMDSVLESFVLLKQSAEDMINSYLIQEAARRAGASQISMTYSRTVEVKLSPDPLPVLGWLTTGTLSVGNKKISFYSPNPYYVSQRWIYENGAVILVQRDNSIMRSPPPMVVVKPAPGNWLEVWVTTVEIDGNDNVSGSGNATVELMLDSVTYSAENSQVATVQITVTSNLTAWRKYFTKKRDEINGTFGAGVSDVQSGTNYVTLNIYGRTAGVDIYYWKRNARFKAFIT